MIYVNDDLISLKDEENWGWLKKKFDEIKKMSNPLRIKIIRLPTIEKGAQPGRNPTGLKEPIKTYQWPLRNTIIRNGMTETWIYTRNKPSKINNELQFRTRYINIRDGNLFIDTQNDTDLAYFILYVSGLIQNGNFIVEDLEGEAETKIKDVSPEALVTLFVSDNPVSPLYGKNEQIRELAYSWGISNADTIGMYQLRLKLKEVVLESERNKALTNRGIDEFVSEVSNMGRMTKYRALIQKALDKNLIGFDSRQNAWCWVSRVTGEFSDYIVPVLPINLDQKERLLFEYLINNAQLFDQIETMVGVKKEEKTNESEATTETKYSHLLWDELRELAKSKGINTKGIKRPQIETELLTKE